jgi:ribokinase
MKIVGLGAVLMDQVAEVERFPKEDDEVFVPKLHCMPGGSAANTTVLCSRLGIETGFIGKIGDDQNGQSLLDDFEKEKVNSDGVSKSDLPTGTVFVAVKKDGQRMMFAHSGAANDLHEQDIDLEYLQSFDHLHMADLENIDILKYTAKQFKGTVSLNAGALIAEKANEALELIENVNILICSEEEAEKISGTEGIENCLRTLHKVGPRIVVITRGARDTKGFDGKEIQTAQAFKVQVVDTTGAGDAFCAGFLVNYLETKDLQDSMLFGNAVASSVIQKRGARSGVEDKEKSEEVPEIPEI